MIKQTNEPKHMRKRKGKRAKKMSHHVQKNPLWTSATSLARH